MQIKSVAAVLLSVALAATTTSCLAGNKHYQNDYRPINSFGLFGGQATNVPTPQAAHGFAGTVPVSSIASEFGNIPSSYFSQANLVTCKVTGVRSGDTFYCLDLNTKNKYFVKLAGVQAPAVQTRPYGWMAKKQLAYMVNGRMVNLQPHSGSGYNITATVYANNQNLNLLMLASGCGSVESGFGAGTPVAANYAKAVAYAQQHQYIMFNPVFKNWR